MLSTESGPESNYLRGTTGFASKFAWVSRILAVILICTYMPLGLHAQDPCDAPILAPPVPPAPPPPSSCLSMKPPGNIADGTKSALACAWIDTPAGHDGTDHLLEAFRLLTSAPLPPNVDKKVLENAPGFDKDNWPNMADSTWGTSIYKHYGYTPYWEEVSVTATTGRR